MKTADVEYMYTEHGYSLCRTQAEEETQESKLANQHVSVCSEESMRKQKKLPDPDPGM